MFFSDYCFAGDAHVQFHHPSKTLAVLQYLPYKRTVTTDLEFIITYPKILDII